MKENDIRPKHLWDRYLELTERDSLNFFKEDSREHFDCPVCSLPGNSEIEKYGFNYDLCEICFTLYVSPRPSEASFQRYYTSSASSEFWSSTFYKETAEARREKLWRPKASLIDLKLKGILGKSYSDYLIVDIGGGYGLFAEEMEKLTENFPLVIEPGPGLAQSCRERHIPVIEKFLEDVRPDDLPSKPKVFVSFELFEHLHNPNKFLKSLYKVMKKNDFFIFTTLSGSGLDIKALWRDSNSIQPPMHLNFFNPISIKKILENTGLEVLEVTTPGKLDIDILSNNTQNLRDPFWKLLIENSNIQQKKDLQKIFSDIGLSSHMMTISKRKD